MNGKQPAAGRETHAKLVLSSMVKLIQHCGAKVIVEGIENRDEALTALDVGGDYLQGYFFARPGLANVPQAHCDNMFAGLTAADSPATAARTQPKMPVDDALAIYASALGIAVANLENNLSFSDATASFLALPQVLRVYLITPDNAHRGDGTSHLALTLIEPTPPRAEKTGDVDGTTVDRLQNVVSRARATPQQVHIAESVPPARYRLSATEGAITLSAAFLRGDQWLVLCADLARA